MSRQVWSYEPCGRQHHAADHAHEELKHGLAHLGEWMCWPSMQVLEQQESEVEEDLAGKHKVIFKW